MKNCIIVHGCPQSEENARDGTYKKHWIPWTKEKLISEGIKVETPEMPRPWEPVYEDYKREFEKYEVNENSILIGHSCGTAFLVRWLGDSKQEIDKLILVAPWKIAGDDQIGKNFYEYPIDESIKSRVKEITIFTSDNEWPDGKKSAKIFQEFLNAKIIELKGMGHYIEKHMGTIEFSELIKEILE